MFSVRHPLDEFSRGDESDYFEMKLGEPDCEAGVPYYRRPISEVFDPLLGAGLDIDVISKPRPTECFGRSILSNTSTTQTNRSPSVYGRFYEDRE